MKRCIFYLPYELDPSASRARMVRPRKMIQAFRDIGYEVFEVTGYANERKQRISELKRRISSGIQFEFMYSEASTMPTLLTEPHHFPTHPFLDYGFYYYIKAQGIKIGLFYSDIFWKFEEYGKNLPAWKKSSALCCYSLDIRMFERVLDRFYLPTLKVAGYLGSEKLASIAEELPPGAEERQIPCRDFSDRDFSAEPLTILYVGGLGGHYQIGELLKAVNSAAHCRLILCCREDEWETERINLTGELSDKIEVVHKSGADLAGLYAQSDVGALLFKRDYYMDMAKPVKTYEYMTYEIPILVTKGLDIGNEIEASGIGWAVEYDYRCIVDQLDRIVSNPACLREKMEKCREEKYRNTWNKRAEAVEKGLTHSEPVQIMNYE